MFLQQIYNRRSISLWSHFTLVFTETITISLPNKDITSATGSDKPQTSGLCQNIQCLMTNRPCFLIKSNFITSLFDGTTTTAFYVKFSNTEIKCQKSHRNTAWCIFTRLTTVTEHGHIYNIFIHTSQSDKNGFQYHNRHRTAVWNTQIHGICFC